MISGGKHIRVSVVPFFLLTLLVLPIFFDRGGIFQSIEHDARGFPASLVLILAVPLLIIYKHHMGHVIVVAASCIPLLIIWLSVGIFNSNHISYVLIGVYLAPILVGYCTNVLLSSFEGTSHSRYYAVALGLVLSVVSIAWISFQISNIMFFGRANGAVWDVFVIYQVWVYWPTVLAIFFCLQAEESSQLALLIKLVLLSAIIATGAREPILFCIFFYLIRFLMMRSFKSFAIMLVSLVVLMGASIILMKFAPEFVISKKIIHQLSGEQGLSAGRFEVVEQFNLAFVNPFVGTGFTSDAIFGSPHNQYLELYYRGGLLVVIPVVSCFIFALFSGRRDKVLVPLLITLMIVSFNINVPLRSPYVAAIIWFLVFRMMHLSRMVIKS